LQIPVACPGVPSEILDPKNTWSDSEKYDATANELSRAFIDNFKQFEGFASEEILLALPKVAENTV